MTRDTRESYAEEDTCMSYESVRALVTRDTREPYAEEDTCMSYESVRAVVTRVTNSFTNSQNSVP